MIRTWLCRTGKMTKNSSGSQSAGSAEVFCDLDHHRHHRHQHRHHRSKPRHSSSTTRSLPSHGSRDHAQPGSRERPGGRGPCSHVTDRAAAVAGSFRQSDTGESPSRIVDASGSSVVAGELLTCERVCLRRWTAITNKVI